MVARTATSSHRRVVRVVHVTLSLVSRGLKRDLQRRFLSGHRYIDRVQPLNGYGTGFQAIVYRLALLVATETYLLINVDSNH